MADKYPKSKQGGLWKNHKATTENKEPPYRGHIVVTEEMLKTLVVLMRNNAWDQSVRKKGELPDLGPRIKLGAWLNTAKETGEKYFGINGDVFYPQEYDHLFDGSEETPAASKEPTPTPVEDPDDDFPF
jgi:hypothetical protein